MTWFRYCDCKVWVEATPCSGSSDHRAFVHENDLPASTSTFVAHGECWTINPSDPKSCLAKNASRHTGPFSDSMTCAECQGCLDCNSCEHSGCSGCAGCPGDTGGWWPGGGGGGAGGGGGYGGGGGDGGGGGGGGNEPSGGSSV